MPTAPVIEPTAIDSETEEILADPEVRASLEALDDPEDREDLLPGRSRRKARAVDVRDDDLRSSPERFG
jgi:hypothetical protein